MIYHSVGAKANLSAPQGRVQGSLWRCDGVVFIQTEHPAIKAVGHEEKRVLSNRTSVLWGLRSMTGIACKVILRYPRITVHEFVVQKASLRTS
jgi:hypothetical protein